MFEDAETRGGGLMDIVPRFVSLDGFLDFELMFEGITFLKFNHFMWNSIGKGKYMF